MANIHPTAIVSSGAVLANDVEIGPYCIVDGDTEIGAGCVLRSHVIVRRYTHMGSGNFVDSHTVLGGEPQDLKFDPSITSHVRIGDDNVFREGVTISRATREGGATVVGSGTYWMSGAHAGHDATVGDRAILANGAAVGGHATLGPRAFLSAHVLVHQFTWIGELVMAQGNGGTSTHVPPYTLIANINNLVGLNTVGLRRAEDISGEDRRQIKEAFGLTYRNALPAVRALERMDQCADWGAAAGKFREFIRRVVQAEPPFRRPLCPMRRRRSNSVEPQ
jgi:UDP-N-acetylglucosamine acyltransferase